MNYFDLHCDTPYRCYKEGLTLFDKKLSVNFEDFVFFDKWYQCFAVWISDDLNNPFEFYKNVILDFNKKIKRAPDNLEPILTVENAALLENDIERVSVLKQDGVKVLTLTWNGKNCVAGGCHTNARLTKFGMQVINQLNEYRIACDLSHLNKPSFFEAIELADFPLASHSCLESLCPHKRNLSDEQAKLIAQKGGIIGVCFYPKFLPKGDVFEGIYKNICRLLEMGLEDNIAIGSDFDGAEMDKKLSRLSNVIKLYSFLCDKSIPKVILEKIFFKNALEFYTKL